MVPGPGNDGCYAVGCLTSYNFNGRTSFHMKITYDQDGKVTTYRDDQIISSENLNPGPRDYDFTVLKE